MADVKISALPAASALTGTELVPIVQGGVTVQSTPAAFVSNGTLAVSGTNLSYTGTLTGGTGVVNIGSGQLVKDASGNLGLGVTPSAWVGDKALQVNWGSISSGYEYSVNVSSVAYRDNTTWKYLVSSQPPARYEQIGGTHRWFTAPSGTAGNAISFTQAMTLDASGRLLVGTTTAAAKLTVDSLGDAYAVFSGRDSSTVGGDVQIKRSSSSTAIGTGPNIYLDDGTPNNTNLIQAGSGNLQFFNYSTGSWTERMRLDTSGNLGLGVTPSAWGSFVPKAIELPKGVALASQTNANAAHLVANAFYDGTWKYKEAAAASSFVTNNTGVAGFAWFTAPSGTAGNAISFTQAMTLDASGNLLVGQTSSGGASGVNANATQIGLGTTTISHVSGTVSGAAYIYFGYNATGVGSITQDGTTAVLYNTTSDQRLKENIVDAPEASALIDAIQVRSFDWKSDGSHQRYGMVAQELHAVAPEAVHKPSDPEEMMAVDYSKLVPMLVKEIQSLRARVAQLESN